MSCHFTYGTSCYYGGTKAKKDTLLCKRVSGTPSLLTPRCLNSTYLQSKPTMEKLEISGSIPFKSRQQQTMRSSSSLSKKQKAKSKKQKAKGSYLTAIQLQPRTEKTKAKSCNLRASFSLKMKAIQLRIQKSY